MRGCLVAGPERSSIDARRGLVERFYRFDRGPKAPFRSRRSRRFLNELGVPVGASTSIQ
ncbi:hypothetical protein PC116_g10232 [Phytophthora cactorum]|uniref:Uncharacterized protein n=1 Tax=Phytophthora cactorum TaxID=29920 RepID=A0A8T1E6H7_9STRA|nr:hypothetical protein Pcac1_g18549 [Phytophthora cactorum]KAG2916564.1 hypothetical protein PC114_g7440 [Phytophthora cactorum]KAG2946808.1 hypothetical protein PC117_g7344 [Phytophthora cactorum]KAG3013572.1 hypothetical protein PC120_g13225 [Phytophthora cactorum]KAG3027898.1 hypothetical protein PC119_g7210 [Phytophthora cactorum]